MESNTYEELRRQFESTPRYFDRQGKPMEMMEWARKCQDDLEYKIVKQEDVGEYLVSTVWVGLNMASWRSMKKQIFETMIFVKDEERKRKDPIDGYQDLYATEEEALEGHARAVLIAKGELSMEEDE